MVRIILSVFLTIFCLTITAQEVSQWRGPDRTGIYNEKDLLSKWPDAGPQLLWSFSDLGQGHASAAVTNSGVFTTGMLDGKGYVFAFDLKGNLRWKKEYGIEWTESHYGVRSTPLVINDRLYHMSSFGKLFCMNTTDGRILWSIDTFKEYGGRNISWGVTENLLYDGNTLFCTPGGREAEMIAVNRNTGKLIWKSAGAGERSAYCSPLLIKVGIKKLIVTRFENSIQGFEATSGKMLWKFDFTTQPYVHPNTPVYIDGYLYCTSGYGLGGVMLKLAADGNSVTEVWKNASLDPKIGGVIVLDGKIYGGGDRNRRMFCLDWKSGKEIYALNQLAPANLISNDGLLYIYGENGNISLVKPGETMFNIISSFIVPLGEGTHWAHMVINRGRLYVRHGSALMVYNLAGN
jgi:outer membrane protein assembly factor BamB